MSGVEIRVPPLRLRKGDILELTQYFLARHEGRGRLTMTPAAVDALIAYDWPGNVRELERMIEGAIATAESRQIRVDDLPVSLRGGYGEHLVPSSQLGDTMRAWGSRYARLVLEKNAGNKRQACRALDISYHTLNSYLRYRAGHAPVARECACARTGVAAELDRLVAGSLRLLKVARRGGGAARSCAAFGDSGIDMQQPNRRQFVAASLAGIPMLAHASAAAPAAFAPQAVSRGQGGPSWWIRCWTRPSPPFESWSPKRMPNRRRARRARARSRPLLAFRPPTSACTTTRSSNVVCGVVRRV